MNNVKVKLALMICLHPVHRGDPKQCSSAICNEMKWKITENRVSMVERKERRTEEMHLDFVSRAVTSSIIKKKGAVDDNAPSCCTSASISETQFVYDTFFQFLASSTGFEREGRETASPSNRLKMHFSLETEVNVSSTSQRDRK